MGARRPNRRRRAPHLYRPGLDIALAGFLLIFTFGMMMVGVHESWLVRDYLWAGLFAAGALADLVLYGKCVTDFLWWMDGFLDYRSVDKNPDDLLASQYDGRHRQP